MDGRHLDDVYELYLLGLLGAEESPPIREHLAEGCPHCAARLSEAARTIYAWVLMQPRNREINNRTQRHPPKP